MVRRRTAPRKKRAAYAKLDSAAPARRGGAAVIVVLGGLVLLNLYVFVWDKKTSVSAIKQQALAGSAASPSMTIPSPPLAPAPTPSPTTAVDGHVVKSDTLGKLLKRSGLSGAEADEVIRALSGVLDFRTIKAGAAYRIERGPDGRVARFELDLSKNHHVRVVRDQTGAMAGSADPL
jgi:hypothetical protein